MNISFTPEPLKAVEKEKVILNDREIGYVELRVDTSLNSSKYLACINLVPTDCTLNAYGFGQTQQDAINDALVKARKNADKVIAAVEGLWREMEVGQ